MASGARAKRFWPSAWLFVAGAVVVSMALVHAARVNVDYGKYDQDSYLAFAIAERTSGFTAPGSRRQMPLYPMFQALFYTPGMPLEAFFERAKRVNIALSVVVGLGVVRALRRLLPKLEARNLALVSVFFVLAFRAPYVQVEVLSYGCIFALFLLLCALWRRPSLPLAAFAGMIAALAFLVKATALLGAYVFLACLTVRELVLLVRRGRISLPRVGALALFVASFAAVVAPYARTSKVLYGSYLYDMNTRYVLWCDSWAEVQQLHLRFGPHEHWRNIPASELPSMGRYIATHSLGQMAWREVRGLAELVGNCMIGHGYAPFFLLLFFFGLALLIQCPELRAKVIRYRDPSWLGWFAIPYFGAHLVMLGFYGVVGAGERFSLAMFLPAMYAMTRAFVGVAGPEHRVRIGALELDWTAFQWAFFALAIVQIVTYWPVAMMTHYAGG